MMSIQEVQQAIDNNSLPINVAEKYLKLYVADVSWQDAIATLWKNSINKIQNQEAAKEHVKKAISCATILPLMEKTTIPDPATNLLFWCTGWAQFGKNDWFSLYLDILKEDIKINETRNEIIRLGIIDPIDISPITRQAYNWLYQKAEEIEDMSNIDTSLLNAKLTNLVKAYGGAVICNIFINHKSNVDKVFNWRSGYFFEKQIHKVYSVEQIKKIKLAELAKTSNKYIKTIEINSGDKNGKQYSF
jgi:hypothetical protein